MYGNAPWFRVGRLLETKEAIRLARNEDSRRHIRFEPVTETDCDLLYRWLCNAEVARWWTPPVSLNEVLEEYVSRSGANGNFRSYIILLDEDPIGYIQAYRDDDRETVGIDLFIGEDAHRHRGLGAAIIRLFLHQHVFADPTVRRCIVDPSPENAIAIAAYQKAGFRRVAQQPDPKVVIMKVDCAIAR